MATKLKFTYEDYLLTEEGKRYELIDGDLLMTPAPNVEHQDISKDLLIILYNQLERKGFGKVFASPIDVVLSNTDVVQPDVLFISKERMNIITKQNIQGAPDLVIEILSEGTEKRDLVFKRKLYHRAGVKEYWIVDPEKRTLEILVHEPDDYASRAVYSGDATVASPAFSQLSFSLSAVFTS